MYKMLEVRSPDPATHGHSMQVTSTSFSEDGDIPKEHVFSAAGGKNVSPQLSWSGAPAGTNSYAVTCFDPDAPTGCGFWHWVVFNIPAGVTSFEAGKPKGTHGYTDYTTSEYGGPWPPPGDGKHRYIFRVYALDVDRIDGASEKTTGGLLTFMMRGHVLATGTITGLFGH
jgi:Raf kinase inhibitor-like YbhB/YbcL family protein